MTDRCLGSLLEAERAAELVQQGLAYSYLPSLEAVLSSELRFLALRYHSPHLPPSRRYGAASNPLPLSHWERRMRSASEGKGVGEGEADQPSPSYGSASA